MILAAEGTIERRILALPVRQHERRIKHFKSPDQSNDFFPPMPSHTTRSMFGVI